MRPKRKRSAVEPLNLSSRRSRALKSHSSLLDGEEDDDIDYVFFLTTVGDDEDRFIEEADADHSSDPQYLSLLEHLREDGELVGDEGAYDRFIEEAKSSDPDNRDPQYLSFLEHLREDGKSCVLVGEGDHGQIVLHKYEPELNVVSGVSIKKKSVASANNFTGVSKKKKSVASANNFRRVLRSDTAKGLQDPGNSKDTSGRRENDKAVRIPKESSCRRRQECKRNEAVPLGNHANPVRENCKRKAPPPRQAKSPGRQREESEQWDDSYMVFLHHLRKDGEVLLFNYDSRTVRYNEDESEECSSSDVEILAQEDILENEGNNPFVTTTMASIDLEATDPGESDHSEFRVELLKVLKSPYNVKEYKDLLKKVKHRRRKEIIREMRGGREVSYPTKRSCPSYLDQYTDLADKLSSAQADRLQKLNILRGFFFYLSRITMEGMFRPWMDQFSMRILPPVAPGLGEQIPLRKAKPSNHFPPTPQLGKQIPCVKAEPSKIFPLTPQLGKQILCVKAEPSKIFPPTPPQFGKPLQCVKVERS